MAILAKGGSEQPVASSFDLYDSLGPMPSDARIYVDLGERNAVRVRGVRQDEDGDLILTVAKIDPNALRKHG